MLTRVELRHATTAVTGASGGIGPAIARTLRAAGSQLILSGRNEAALRALASELDAEVVIADLAKPADVADLADAIGTADVLVANAALPGAGAVTSFSTEEIDRLLNVNLRAPIVLSRLLAPAFAERGQGHFVFISSLAAVFPTPSLTLYNATKSALDAYALSLRGELLGDGVGVSLMHLGPISDAGMWAETGLALPGLRANSPHDVGAAVVRAIERNRTHITVAPVALRLGASVARVAPNLYARVAPRLGARRVTDHMVEALRDKR